MLTSSEPLTIEVPASNSRRSSVTSNDFDIVQQNPLPTRPPWVPTLISIAFLVVAMYFNCVSQVICENMANTERIPPLHYDLLFTVIPRVYWDALADYWVGFLILLTFVRFIVTPLRFIVLKRHAVIVGFLFLLRTFSIILTPLPNPQLTCHPTAIGNPFIEGLKILFGLHKTCADMFFSGHAANLVIVGLVWHHYSHASPISDFDPLSKILKRWADLPVVSSLGDVQRCTTAKLFIWIAVIIGEYLIIATRLHYSIDVFAGILFATLSWKLYHHYIKTCNTRFNHFNQLLVWFEKDSSDLISIWQSMGTHPTTLLNEPISPNSVQLNVSNDQVFLV